MDVKNLPLSWCIVDKKVHLKSTIVNIREIEWICLENFENMSDFHSKITTEYSRNKILIRGVNKPLSDYLSIYEFRKYLIGFEAAINLKPELQWKESLKKLIKRGKKHTKVIELDYTDGAVLKLNEFFKETRHSNKPQLNNLFVTEFHPYLRLFVAIDRNNTWQGAVLISRNGDSSYHTELLLKKNKSPVGIMENLIVTIAETLKKENFEEYNLGEVPFVKNNFSSYPFGSILNKFKPIVAMFYNYEGLFYFKNKFSPNWREVFLCTNSKLSILHIYHLTLKTNLIKLVFHRILEITRYWDRK